ncbi:hypothetical protein [Paeniglutamicibacter antarcticus]|uniref:Uncharacterized protein n=1 Tax=Paeniglutamicibacter antarcticus TaxID=494023 RepID=A0ABP9TGE1_9MICC
MGQQDQAQQNEPGLEQKSAEDDSVSDVPSTEEEIDPGINQDVPSAESFSSEPADEAAGNVTG